MPEMGITSIRTESANLNFSKGGSTSIYVDQNAANASDKNDGYSWERPKETIAGAIAVPTERIKETVANAEFDSSGNVCSSII